MKFLVALTLAALCVLAAAQDRHVLFARNSHPSVWTRGDRIAKNDEVTFIVAMRQQNLNVLEKKFWAISTPGSPEYRQFMSREEIMDIIAPSQPTNERIWTWLENAGIASSAITPLGDAVQVSTAAHRVEALLNTELYYFKHKDGRVIARQYGSYSIPAELRHDIDLISGLSEFPFDLADPRTHHNVNGPNANIAIVPQTIQSAYKTPSNHSADPKSSQGVIEFQGQSYSSSDLKSFAQEVGLNIEALSSTHIIGPNDPSNPGDEATLDIQYIAAVGLGGQNWFWLEQASNWLYGFGNHFFNTATVPDVVSISYGWSEASQCQQGIGGSECNQLGIDSTQYVQRVNTEFMKIGARGVSIIVASGDSGANGRTDGLCVEKHLNPTFPAASPYVTAVGATQITNAQTNLPNPPPVCSSYTCASGGTEEAVSYDQAHFASGGGFSNVASTPSYQQAAVSKYLSTATLPPSTYFNSSGRAYPDVAAFGSAIAIFINGGTNLIGGTSASSPIFAGAIALLNDDVISSTGKPLGFLNPTLYDMGEKCPECFNDITIGDNKCTEDGCGLFGSCKGYVCAKGWDPVTGLGSPNYPAMLNYLKSNL